MVAKGGGGVPATGQGGADPGPAGASPDPSGFPSAPQRSTLRRTRIPKVRRVPSFFPEVTQK